MWLGPLVLFCSIFLCTWAPRDFYFLVRKSPVQPLSFLAVTAIPTSSPLAIQEHRHRSSWRGEALAQQSTLLLLNFMMAQRMCCQILDRCVGMAIALPSFLHTIEEHRHRSRKKRRRVSQATCNLGCCDYGGGSCWLLCVFVFCAVVVSVLSYQRYQRYLLCKKLISDWPKWPIFCAHITKKCITKQTKF